jgi:hypothetical protein
VAGVFVRPVWSQQSAELSNRLRTVDITGCEFVPLPFDSPFAALSGGQGGVVLDGRSLENANLVCDDRVTLDGRRVFYPQAARGAILPQTQVLASGHVTLNGCPEAGLTNAEAFAKYGVCFGGTLPPEGAVTVPGVVGLVGVN